MGSGKPSQSGGAPSPSVDVHGTIQELDGLRGIAVLLVLIHHYWPREGRWAAYHDIAQLGWMGVDLFFVVSGFLITGILLDTRGAPRYFSRFYMRRSLRILPLYSLFILLAFSLIPALQGGPWSQTEFVRTSGSPWWYILYQGNHREAFSGQTPAYVLAPLWSLAIEEQFYLFFPLLVFRVPRARLRGVLIALLLAALVFRSVTTLLWPANERLQGLATPARIDTLATGALLALGARDGWLSIDRRRLGRLLAAAVVLGSVLFLLGGLDMTRAFGRTLGYSLVALFFGGVVLWTVLGRAAASTAWLRWAPLRSLGKICYGVYLLQRPVQVFVCKLAAAAGHPLSPASLLPLPIVLAATVLVATGSWFLLERPMLRLKHRFAVAGHPQERAGG